MNRVEDILYKKKLLARIIRSSFLKKKGINFFTPNSQSQQLAYMNHPKNHIIQPHLHKNRLKKIYNTSETLIILEGRLKVDFYNDQKKFLFSKILKKNDIIILIAGGHGFKILNNCKFIEVKQGPYNKKKDKIKF